MSFVNFRVSKELADSSVICLHPLKSRRSKFGHFKASSRKNSSVTSLQLFNWKLFRFVNVGIVEISTEKIIRQLRFKFFKFYLIIIYVNTNICVSTQSTTCPNSKKNTISAHLPFRLFGYLCITTQWLGKIKLFLKDRTRISRILIDMSSGNDNVDGRFV